MTRLFPPNKEPRVAAKLQLRCVWSASALVCPSLKWDLVLGWLRVRHGLLAAIAAHALHNAIAMGWTIIGLLEGAESFQLLSHGG